MSDPGQKTEGGALYRHPYPSPDLAARYPFVAHEHQRVDDRTMRDRAESFRASADRRRSVRMFSSDPVPRDLIEAAVVSDMVEGVVAANRLDSRGADTVRAALWVAVDGPALAA